MAALAWLQYRRAPPALDEQLVVEQNVLTAFLDGELVRGTEALDPGTLRGQAHTFEVHRPDRERASGFLSHPDGTPPYAWVVGQRADFVLDILDPVDRVLRLDLASAAEGEQELQVEFNGRPVGAAQIGAPGPGGQLAGVFFEIPADVQQPGANRVTLRFERSESRQLIGEPWPLPLSAALRHVRFRTPELIEELPGPPPLAGLLTEPVGGRPAAVLVLPADTEARAALRLPVASRVVLRFTLLETPLPLELTIATEDGRQWTLQTFGPESRMPVEVRHDLAPWSGRAVQLAFRARQAPTADDTTVGAVDPADDTGTPEPGLACRITGGQILVPARDLPAAPADPQARPAAAADPGRPSFLVVLLDACAGDATLIEYHGRRVTPALDSLAESGTVFEHALAPASYTLASVASLLTGQDIFRHGMAQVAQHGLTATLPPGTPTLAALLSQAGYRTAAWITNPNGGGVFGYGRGFEHFEELFRDPELFDEGVDGRELPPRLADFLAESRGQPFLAWVHVFEPHAPYEAPPDLTEAFVAPYSGPAAGVRGWLDAVRKGEWRPTVDDWRHVREQYIARVAWSDRILGELLAELSRSGREEDTVVCVLSDHGEAFGQGGSVEHGDFVTQPELQVPLVLRVPGRAAARRGEPVSVMDLAPTLLGLAGLPVPSDMDGRDLLGQAAAEPRNFHARSAQLLPSLAIQRDGRKLVVNLATRRVALYDLRDDPFEQTDRHAEQPVTTAILLRELTSAVCAGELALAERELDAEREWFDPGMNQAIMDLGYTGVPVFTGNVPDDLPLCTLLRALQRRL